MEAKASPCAWLLSVSDTAGVRLSGPGEVWLLLWVGVVLLASAAAGAGVLGLDCSAVEAAGGEEAAWEAA